MVQTPSVMLEEGVEGKIMGSEVAQASPAESASLLPPRKRLLAGLKRQNSDCSPPVSDELRGHLRCLLNSSELTAEEIIETLRSAAQTTAKTAAAARAIATEKAIAAMKAKEFARRVLKLVASVSGGEHCRRNFRRRKAIRRTHTPTDEDLSRRWGRTMAGSTGISIKLKNPGEASGNTGEEGTIIHNEIPTLPSEDYSEPSIDEEPSEKSDRTVKSFTGEEAEKVEEDREELSSLRFMRNSSEIERSERKKRKKDTPGEATESKGNPLSREANSMEQDHKPGGKRSDEGETTSVWRSKRLKTSQCHSEGENLRKLCSIPAIKAASALVKVD